MNRIQFKFENCLVGCLVGDCLGRDFEGEECPDMSNLNYQLSIIKNVQPNHFEYTDDTALTRAVCESLIASKGLNIPNLAESLIATYAKEPKRGYAKGAINLFESLKKYLTKNKLKENCFHPSLSLFNGTGSFGNGSAMRISPIALQTLNKSEYEMIMSVILSVNLTHAHYLAVIGAILQCYSIRLMLKSTIQQSEKVSFAFLNDFFDQIINFTLYTEENYNNFLSSEAISQITKLCVDMQLYVQIIKSYNDQFKKNSILKHAFSERLNKLKQLFVKCENGHVFKLKEFHKEYAKCDITALESIPIALFAFMIATNPKCMNEINSKLKVTNSFQIYNHFERVILYAISLGGDTDTIASMAGSIVGAFYDEKLSNMLHIFQSCEGYKDMCKYAHDLLYLTNQMDQSGGLPIAETVDIGEKHKTEYDSDNDARNNQISIKKREKKSRVKTCAII